MNLVKETHTKQSRKYHQWCRSNPRGTDLAQGTVCFETHRMVQLFRLLDLGPAVANANSACATILYGKWPRSRHVNMPRLWFGLHTFCLDLDFESIFPPECIQRALSVDVGKSKMQWTEWRLSGNVLYVLSQCYKFNFMIFRNVLLFCWMTLNDIEPVVNLINNDHFTKCMNTER